MAFKLRFIHFEHRQGTKSYYLVWVLNPDNDAALVVRRWGKKGQLGQFKIESGHSFLMNKDLEGEIEQREKRGYNEISDQHHVCQTVEDAQKLLSLPIHYWSKLGETHIKTVFGIDVPKGSTREAAPLEFEDDPKTGRKRVKDKPILRKEPEAPKVPTLEEEQKHNPLWGMF